VVRRLGSTDGDINEQGTVFERCRHHWVVFKMKGAVLQKECKPDQFKYNKCSTVADMGDRLATIVIGQKVGGCCAPFWEDRRRSEAEATAGHNH